MFTPEESRWYLWLGGGKNCPSSQDTPEIDKQRIKLAKQLAAANG